MVAEGDSMLSCRPPSPGELIEARNKLTAPDDAKDHLIAGQVQTLECPKSTAISEPRPSTPPQDEEERRAGFRPAPELLGCTLVDFPTAKFRRRRCELCGDCFTCYSGDLRSSEDARTGCSWHSEWQKDDDETERFDEDYYDAPDMLADEYSEMFHRRFSSGRGGERRPKKIDKVRRAQRQVRDKQFRPKNVLRNTGGIPVTKVLVKQDIKRRNASRQEKCASAIETKKRNIERRLAALKQKRRGPPNNYISSDPAPTAQRQYVQPVTHELREADISQYASSTEEAELLKVLAIMQHRELLPEDYDLLLRLDDKVSKKTLDYERLENLRTKLITIADIEDIMKSDFAGTICAVCMECYYVDQVVKWLPCQHVFHNNCIDNWLSNAGCICPLDGLEV